MLSRIKLAFATLGICCAFSLMYGERLILNYKVMEPSLNGAIPPNFVKELNNTADIITSSSIQFTEKTEPISCPPIQATYTPHLASINSLPFSQHNLWYEEKLTKKTLKPLSHYDIKTTKKILVWSRTWNGLPK